MARKNVYMAYDSIPKLSAVGGPRGSYARRTQAESYHAALEAESLDRLILSAGALGGGMDML